MPKLHKTEKQRQKSPAEFFADNAAIAGFDNPGKSLYTTIRELVENGLDAAESVGTLPTIKISITEMSQTSFNKFRGVAGANSRSDKSLFTSKAEKQAVKKAKLNATLDSDASSDDDDVVVEPPAKKTKKAAASNTSTAASDMYYTVTVSDNGCGMSHAAVPNLLGIVLSGSKYGVRQTRGKFGLGAKMALIWSKKSTGVPVRVKSAHMTEPGQVPPSVSTCVLDIDIYKNQPRTEFHEKEDNDEGFIGTEFTVTVGGNWIKYGKFIKRYLQQLAIVTPYADFEFEFVSESASKNVAFHYERRSENMPEESKEIAYHPSSVNNLLVQQLIDDTKSKTLLQFLTCDFSGVRKAVAQRVIAELSVGDEEFHEKMNPKEIDVKQINRLCQILTSVKEFAAPDGKCLSPAGEYNMRLGIEKMYTPDLLFTSSENPSAYDGHPFVIEAAVAWGGGCRDKLNVTRFANRIPLLFEAGGDVSSKVVNKGIDWKSYGVDKEQHKLEIFVSIVSTKIPFKGTGKEYIGDDIDPIKLSIKKAIQSCCRQLKEVLSKKKHLNDIKTRRNKIVKYVPDASRAVFGLLEQMGARKKAAGLAVTGFEKQVMGDIAKKVMTAKVFENRLRELVDKELSKADDDDVFEKEKKGGTGVNEQSVFLKVMGDELMDWEKVVDVGFGIFIPSIKCSGASKWRQLTAEEKSQRAVVVVESGGVGEDTKVEAEEVKMSD